VEQELIERVSNKERKKRKGKEMREVSDDLSEGGGVMIQGRVRAGHFVFDFYVSLFVCVWDHKLYLYP
jgi:hypothetical protein